MILHYTNSEKLNRAYYIKQLEIANIKWANTLPLELKQGQNIFIESPQGNDS